MPTSVQSGYLRAARQQPRLCRARWKPQKEAENLGAARKQAKSACSGRTGLGPPQVLRSPNPREPADTVEAEVSHKVPPRACAQGSGVGARAAHAPCAGVVGGGGGAGAGPRTRCGQGRCRARAESGGERSGVGRGAGMRARGRYGHYQRPLLASWPRRLCGGLRGSERQWSERLLEVLGTGWRTRERPSGDGGLRCLWASAPRGRAWTCRTREGHFRKLRGRVRCKG